MIPKIFHIIWFGARIPMSYELNIILLARWNPDFKIYLWVDSNLVPIIMRLKNFPNIKVFYYADFYVKLKENESLAEFVDLELNHRPESDKPLTFISTKAKEAQKVEPSIMNLGNPAAASDMFRLDVLYYYGGVYLDTDIRCIAKVDLTHIKQKDYGFQFNTVYGPYNARTGAGCINNLLVSNQGSKFIELMRKNIKQEYQLPTTLRSITMREHQALAKRLIISMSGPGQIAKVLKSEGLLSGDSDDFILSKAFLASFIIKNDNTWLAKGKQSLQQREQDLSKSVTSMQHRWRQSRSH